MASSFSSSIDRFKYFNIAMASLLITLSSVLASAATTAEGRQKPFQKIYAFGDSYTDTGNSRSATGPICFTFVSNLPYGRTFFHRPTNRYSDGRLVIDFVAQALSLPFIPPYGDKEADTSSGVNFAVAGATAIPYSFFLKNNLSLDNIPQSLQTQLSWFNQFLEARGCRGARPSRNCRAAFDDALFWVGEIGANDYSYTIGSSVSSSTVQKLAISSVTSFLRAILTKGAKYVVVQGLLTTGCLPISLALAADSDRDNIGCVGSRNKESYTHNSILQSELADLTRQFPHAVIIYADYWNVYRSVMKNPRKYGFKETFKACCGSGGGAYNFDVFAACGSPPSGSCPSPSEYVNWDGAHLTEAMYKVVSDSFLNGTFCHPPFSYLLSRKQKSG